MRWGLAGRLRGKDPRLQVGLDRYLMTPSETAELKARASTLNGQPVTQPPVVKVEQIAPNGEPVPDSGRDFEMLPLADAPGLWQLSLKGLEEGSWRITTTHRQGELKGLMEVRDLLVRSQNALEGLDLGGDLPALTRLAAAGGHLAGTMDQADALLKDFASKLKPRPQEHRQTIRFWTSYPALLLVVALLSAEWVLRKRQGLP
jgi:hypothetical protein